MHGDDGAGHRRTQLGSVAPATRSRSASRRSIASRRVSGRRRVVAPSACTHSSAVGVHRERRDAGAVDRPAGRRASIDGRRRPVDVERALTRRRRPRRSGAPPRARRARAGSRAASGRAPDPLRRRDPPRRAVSRRDRGLSRQRCRRAEAPRPTAPRPRTPASDRSARCRGRRPRPPDPRAASRRNAMFVSTPSTHRLGERARRAAPAPRRDRRRARSPSRSSGRSRP